MKAIVKLYKDINGKIVDFTINDKHITVSEYITLSAILNGLRSVGIKLDIRTIENFS